MELQARNGIGIQSRSNVRKAASWKSGVPSRHSGPTAKKATVSASNCSFRLWLICALVYY